jgi:hypothetical protein
MAENWTALRQRRWGETFRRDKWWAAPLVVFAALSGFIVYATWAALQNAHYTFGEYLSPFYSPVLFGDSPHAWFGPRPAWWPSFLPFSPALLILPFPAGFRLTCYYYRGAYYKAFWQDPPSCAVGEPRSKYLGENYLPLILQNVHRYFLYAALLFLVILSYDAWRAMWFDDGAGGFRFGIGGGTIVLTLNVILLGGYTFGCHSLRHLVGGGLNVFSAAPIRARCHACVSCFNRRHMAWAWCSLVWVAFSDLYVRLCSMGILTDFRMI